MAVTGNEPISAANLAEVIEALEPMMGGGSCSIAAPPIPELTAEP